MAATVVTSVIFTDLVASTEMSSRLGAEAAEELRTTHFGLLRAAVAATGGTEVKNLGDGLMVVFSSVNGGLAGAVGRARALVAEAGATAAEFGCSGLVRRANDMELRLAEHNSP